MPTYVVTSTPQRLSKENKAAIANHITDIHCSVTGAPRYFVQILFNDVPSENYFLAGKKLEEDNIYVHGHIREGRTTEAKQKICLTLWTRWLVRPGQIRRAFKSI